MEGVVGGGIGMGNTCKSMADSFQCMTKPTKYSKVIILQLIKNKNLKKKRNKKKSNKQPNSTTKANREGRYEETQG